jgi:hypothetical protein
MALITRALGSGTGPFAAEALLAAKIYVLAAIVGGALAIGSAKLGYPLFGFSTNPESTKAIPQPPDHSPPTKVIPQSPDHSLSPLRPPASIASDAIAELKKVVPKDPAIVIGTPVFDAKKQYMGRVTQVSQAPHREYGSPVKEMRLYLTVEDDSGAAQTIEYGRVEWRADSAVDNPKLGILLASASPDTNPHLEK